MLGAVLGLSSLHMKEVEILENPNLVAWEEDSI